MSDRPRIPRRPAATSPAEIAAIAQREDWLTPLPAITRVVLRPWQQVLFWGLRLYILGMLAVIGWTFWRAAS